jgi:DNA polymerase I-like protein with 3'-5' exonuclease and polymerase domains
MEALLKELSIVPFRTPTGRPKIDEDSILAYIDNASTPEAVGVLSNIREEAKARTLISQFLEIGITNDDRYHPSYDLSKAKTGREASGGADEGGPQLQNIPRRIRRIFVADRS